VKRRRQRPSLKRGAPLIVPSGGTKARDQTLLGLNAVSTHGAPAMKGLVLWLVGIPIPIIILLYLFTPL
jgi:hypothetical protein